MVDDDDPSQGIDPTKQALVTIDAGPPTSTISSLPTTTSPTFTVNWSGTDVAGGSGIASYNIYVSDDGGPFTEFQAGTTATSATFTGQVGHTYGFYSVAIDNVGNIQPTPASAQQTIQIVVPLTIVSIGQVGANPRNSAVSTISVGLSEAPGPQSFNYEALTLSDNGGPNLITSAVTVTLSATDSYVIGGLGALTAAEGEYTLTVNAADILDPYGNPGIGSLSASWLMDTTPPTSTVNPLPAQMISTSFTVSVTASDPSGANTSPPSGVASIAIYDSANGGAFTLFTTVSPSNPSATFTGQAGNTYRFYSVATDNAGNEQPVPASAEATTTIVNSLSLVVATQPPAGVLAGNAFSLTVDVFDSQDQIDSSYDGCLTVSFANNPSASALGGSTTAPVLNGVATFSGLTISNPGLAYALRVSAIGDGSVITANFDVAGYQLVASGASENLVWYGTSGSDQVQFAQTATDTVQITVSELGGLAFNFTGTVTGVTGDVVVNEYDVAGDADVVDSSGLTTIPSYITVGNGNDTLIGGGGANTIVAGNGSNTIYGNGIGNSPNASGVEDPSNTITVGIGNNIIYGNYSGSGYQGGNNTITAGDGNNTIYGNYGEGGRQNFAFGYPIFDGAEGSNNTITVGNGGNTIYGNYGTADGGEGGSNTIIAGNGNDVIFGNAGGNDPQRLCGSNFIQVGNGNDTIYGNLGGDGGEGGNNTILTGSGQDTIYGNFGGDGGEGGNNLIVAGGGNDTIYAHCALPVTSRTSGTTAEGQDFIIGGTGADTVYGWPAGYTLGANNGDLFIAGATNLGLCRARFGAGGMGLVGQLRHAACRLERCQRSGGCQWQQLPELGHDGDWQHGGR